MALMFRGTALQIVVLGHFRQSRCLVSSLVTWLVSSCHAGTGVQSLVGPFGILFPESLHWL